MPAWSVGVIAGGVPGGFAGPLIKRDAHRRFPERHKRALRRGHCPACWYDIANIEAAIHGCVVCPECGAAWRVPKSNSK